MISTIETYEQGTGRLIERREPDVDAMLWRVFDGDGKAIREEPIHASELPPPEPPDPFALIAEKLDEYADLLRSDNRKNEADKMHEVAEVARAASGR